MTDTRDEHSQTPREVGTVAREHARERSAVRLGQIALVLQGGGALGAYQVGVFRALAEAGYSPDWFAGTSIGAINAAIMAGNAPEQQLARLEKFWKDISRTVPGERRPGGHSDAPLMPGVPGRPQLLASRASFTGA